MQKQTTEVKSAQGGQKRTTVGIAEYEVFDSVSEAVSVLAEPKVLSLINSQHRTNALNLIRQTATATPSKARLQELAMARITPEELGNCAGDAAAVKALLEAKVATIEAEIKADKAAAADLAGNVEAEAIDPDDED